jgi:hypothetical protein
MIGLNINGIFDGKRKEFNTLFRKIRAELKLKNAQEDYFGDAQKKKNRWQNNSPQQNPIQ